MAQDSDSDDNFDKTSLELEEVKTKKAAPQDHRGDENNAAIKKSLQKSETPNRKRKYSNSDEDFAVGSTNTDEERKKRRHSAMLYQKYLNRGGPVHPGSKWTPKGKPDCLEGLCFLITGVLESLEREEAQRLIREHGGRYTKSVSGKVNYMVIGVDAGPAKIERAKKFGTQMISEDDLIDLICVRSGIPNQNIQTNSSTSEEVEIKSPKN